jgi:hypothetical protein
MSIEVAKLPCKKQPTQPGLQNTRLHYQLMPEKLTIQTIQRNEGVLNNTGALCI